MTDRLGPYELNQIYTGDARELAQAIPDESVDLIFTDPVYDRIDDYRWLAETAVRVLKPEGALLCWSNGKWHKKNTDWLEDAGLVYRYGFAHCQIRYGAAFNGKIISKCNRVLWFDVAEQSKQTGYIIDGFGEPTHSDNKAFHWGKSKNYTRHIISAFADHNAIVFDPFTGGGTVPAVCKMLGRNYLAFEIEPTTADLARQRVAMTQPPLFVVQPEQIEMSIMAEVRQ